MIYLVILVLAAAAGLLRLWLQQRRQRRNLEPGNLRQSLERLAERPVPTGPPPSGGRARSGTGTSSRHARVPQGGRTAALGPASPRGSRRAAGRPEPLEPARREAARRRIEARRAARTRATG